MTKDSLNLALIATLPIGWQVATTSVASHTNPLVLNGLDALDGPTPDLDAMHDWLHRLDAKADLALAHAVLAHVERPVLKAMPIELYADHVRWVGPPVEGSLELWLQINPLTPPLVLPVKAENNEAVFSDLSAESKEALERLIFRHHRRQVRKQREN